MPKVYKTYLELVKELGLPMDLKSPNDSLPHNVPKQKERRRVPHWWDTHRDSEPDGQNLNWSPRCSARYTYQVRNLVHSDIVVE